MKLFHSVGPHCDLESASVPNIILANVPGISVQGPDVYGPAPYSKYDGALSRPPSRATNNKSPLNRVIDLTADSAMGNLN
jgi:hypothetical protein